MEVIDFGRFQTRNAAMKDVLRLAEKASVTQASLFIFGEVGTGRRTLARWIHDHSPLRNARFLIWSPEEVEPNVLRDGDTVLFENIHELSTIHLLRIRKLLDQYATTKIRWIATSLIDPKTWMGSSSLAMDLAYRLCVVTFQMPRLQDRQEDIQILSEMFLQVACLVSSLPHKKLSEGALDFLRMYSWSGHVAELMNVIERAALKSETSEVGAEDFSFLQAAKTSTQLLQLGQTGISLFEMEKKLIFQTLEMTRHNKTRAAEILGISIRTLRNKLNCYREAEAS